MVDISPRRNSPKSRGLHFQQSVIDAIDTLSSNKGSSLRDIENYLENDRYGGSSSADILSQLQKAVDNGTLSVIDGKYKINERARRRRSRRRKRSASPRRGRSRKRTGSRKRSRSRRRSGSRKKSGGRRKRRRSRKPHPGHAPGDGCGQ